MKEQSNSPYGRTVRLVLGPGVVAEVWVVGRDLDAGEWERRARETLEYHYRLFAERTGNGTQAACTAYGIAAN